MKALEKYVHDKNVVAVLFDEDEQILDPKNLTRQQASDLWNSVESALSPENLTCDGELSQAKVHAKQKYLLQVQQELLDLKF